MTHEEVERRPPGISIRNAAKETGIPEKRIRRAAENGEVKTVEFGGVAKLPI